MKAEWGKTGSLALPLAMIAALLCVGCTNFFGKQPSSGAPASLTVSFSAPSAKTITASSSDLLGAVSTLAIAVVNGSGTTVASGSVNYSYSSGTTETFASLSAATYTVDVNAYDASSNLIATGTQTVAMAGNTSITVNLTFSQTSTVTSGGFSLNIAWPTSTTLPYVYAKLDSATASNFFNATGTVSSSNYTATIAKSGLSSGSHLLYIYFAASSTATTYLGPYIETVNIWDSVTSTSWLDGSGNCQSQRTFAASDFASSNANLEGLSISGATLSPAFAAGTTSYSLSSGFTGTSFSFTATTVSGTQTAAYTWNGAAQSWTSVSGDVFTASSLSLVSGLNTLVLTVTAPDKQTKQTYTITVSCGTAGVTVSNPSTTYQGLGFATSASVVQNQSFSLETTNSALQAITSGWTWSSNGVTEGQDTSPTFTLSPSDTSAMIGTYTISANVAAGGVLYSGGLVLTVTRQSTLNPSGATTTFAGSSSSASGYVDGSASVARFSKPVAIATDGTKLYIADYSNNAVRQIVIATGEVSTLAGGTLGFSDGIGTAASFKGPNGITLSGNNLYVSDNNNFAIRKISLSTGAVTTLAGGTQGSADGIGAAARFNFPGCLTTDGTNLYLADNSNNEIRKITIDTGKVTTLAGSTSPGNSNGTGSSASFNCPWGITTDGVNLYVSDSNGNDIRRIVISTGVVTTLVVASAGLNNPMGLATDGSNLYVADLGSNMIRKISIATGAMTTLAGSATAGSSDGNGASAGFQAPRAIAIYGSTLYLVDGGNNAIREIQ